MINNQFVFKLRASQEEWELLEKIIARFGKGNINRWVNFQTYLFCKNNLLPIYDGKDNGESINEMSERKIIITARSISDSLTNLQLLEMFSNRTGKTISQVINKFVVDPPLHEEYKQVMLLQD